MSENFKKCSEQFRWRTYEHLLTTSSSKFEGESVLHDNVNWSPVARGQWLRALESLTNKNM